MKNPYYDQSLDALSTACNRLARELGDARQRSPDERRELAADVRHLLLAIALHFQVGDSIPGSPENKMRYGAQPNIVDVFGAWYRGQVETARHQARKEALLRAAHLVLDRAANRYLHPVLGVIRLGDPISVGTRSDEGLMQCLGELEEMRAGRRPKPDLSAPFWS